MGLRNPADVTQKMLEGTEEEPTRLNHATSGDATIGMTLWAITSRHMAMITNFTST